MPFCEWEASTNETPIMFARHGMATEKVFVWPEPTCEATVRAAVSERGMRGAAETCDGMPRDAAATTKAITNRRLFCMNEWTSPCFP